MQCGKTFTILNLRLLIEILNLKLTTMLFFLWYFPLHFSLRQFYEALLELLTIK